MPNFINRSWPILLMPLWWIFWLIGLILHNLHFNLRNKYRRIKGKKRDKKAKKNPQDKKEVINNESSSNTHI